MKVTTTTLLTAKFADIVVGECFKKPGKDDVYIKYTNLHGGVRAVNLGTGTAYETWLPNTVVIKVDAEVIVHG